MYKKYRRGPVYLFSLTITTGLLSSNNQIANGSIFTLPHEIIVKIVVDIEPNYEWMQEASKSRLKDFQRDLQSHVLPSYRLLTTCKGFYLNQPLKEALKKALLSDPSLMQNIIVLNDILMKYSPRELGLIDKFYIEDAQIIEYTDFLKLNFDKPIIAKRKIYTNDTKSTFFSLPEFLIKNMQSFFVNRENGTFKLNLSDIETMLKNHFIILSWVLINTDLTLPGWKNHNISIAKFVLKELQEGTVFVTFMRDGLPEQIDVKEVPPEIVERYSIRYELKEIPKTIPVDLTLFLSDEAFEKLHTAANSKTKSDEYNRRLLSWILPELPHGPIKQTWIAYFSQRMRRVLSGLFKAVHFLICIVKDCIGIR